MGNASSQLKVHINGALNVGCSRTEIIEVIIQMAVYAGFPSPLNGLQQRRFSIREGRFLKQNPYS
jgi:4-carboxymuconolactone decarboxylase